MRQPKGQVLVGAIILLVILAILVPAIISYVDNESKWTVKEQRTTRAFQLAEGAIERGYQRVIVSSGVWNALQAGTALTGYHFDQTYTASEGGAYEINITSGPGSQSITITGVARDASTREVRAIRATFGDSASNSALYAAGGLTLTSNPGVEWGPIFSPAAIITDKLHPRFYSSANVSLDPNGATPPNSDNVQWWSYYANMPPAPQVDTQAYLSSATLQGAGHVKPGGTYQMRTDVCAGAASCSGVYYFSGDTTIQPPWAFINNGALVVMGNLTINGTVGTGAYAATLPSNAWKEYGNDWAYYRTTYDGSAPAVFPGINGAYSPGTLTTSINYVLVHGFLYTSGKVDVNGGGNMSVHGSMYIGDSSNLAGSHVTLYYDDATTIMTKNVTLARSSWQEVGGCDWSGTHVSCP